MDCFGPQWVDHAQKIIDRWTRIVHEDDLVLVPGDVSWAMKLHEAKPDLELLEALPGYKLFTKGNHDYWWPKKKRDFRFRSLTSLRFLHGRTLRAGRLAIAATRAWTIPGDSWFKAEDQKIYEKEVRYLRSALEAMGDASFRICMLHYPPFNDALDPGAFVSLLQSYGVHQVVFGHVHGPGSLDVVRTGLYQGITYHLTACDAIDFTPRKILDLPDEVREALHEAWKQGSSSLLSFPIQT